MTYDGPLTRTLADEERACAREFDPVEFRYDPCDEAVPLEECVNCGYPDDRRLMVDVGAGWVHDGVCAREWETREGDEAA